MRVSGAGADGDGSRGEGDGVGVVDGWDDGTTGLGLWDLRFGEEGSVGAATIVGAGMFAGRGGAGCWGGCGR